MRGVQSCRFRIALRSNYNVVNWAGCAAFPMTRAVGWLRRRLSPSRHRNCASPGLRRKSVSCELRLSTSSLKVGTRIYRDYPALRSLGWGGSAKVESRSFEIQQTSRDSSSAVSTPTFATNYSLEISRRDLADLHPFAFLRSENSRFISCYFEVRMRCLRGSGKRRIKLCIAPQDTASSASASSS